MQPKRVNHSQEDLFQSRLSTQLNPRHGLLVVSDKIRWEDLEGEYQELYCDDGKGGCPPKPIRLMVGLLLLQYLHDLSDEGVVKTWVENPYWQYFCGYDYLQWEFPINPSSLSRFRGRLGKEGLEKVLKLTIKAGVKVGVVKPSDFEKVIVDTTVMPKNIAFPTDSCLLNKSRERMVKLAVKHKVPLRQNYNVVCKKLLRQISGYVHAQQMKRAKAGIRKMKTYTGRVLRDIRRKIEGQNDLQEMFKSELAKADRLLGQSRKSKNKIYSLHEPDTECISKGKARQKYEFGCKASFVITHGKNCGFVLAGEALHGNPYDGHTLNASLSLSQKMTGVKAKKAFVDAGYKGHGIEDEDLTIWCSRQKRGVTGWIKKQLKRRQAIEPHFGHMKTEGKLGRCRLWGIHGDQVHAVMVASGYNLRLILNHIKRFCAQVFQMCFICLCV